MGLLVSVACRNCGFQSRELGGIGGSYGMSGDVVLTVVCPGERTLVDVGTPLNMARGDSMPPLEGEWPPSEPCRLCGATDHRPWEPERAVCPACGERACEVIQVGLWD
jgi:hypothetical protein